ncbi:hypothetical protein Sango_2719900 [Sesamum angolense]|uniref:Uncharacterized protein n=1 Tax=Sesamum angolense TaxID=2727404 RepID=A0AAE1W3J6_9LAMI|nr:hypothetical protein Sango_2719900 [Sesamum angolense]
MRIVLNFEEQGYVLNGPPSSALPEDFSPEERLMFEKWHGDNRKVCNIILVSMSNDIRKQYDKLDGVSSIMLRMSNVCAVPDRHIRYATKKSFSWTKLAKGSTEQSHRVKMLSLVEKLEGLKAGLDNDTYIDERLRPPKRMTRWPDTRRGRMERGRLLQPLHALPMPLLPLLPLWEWAKGKAKPGVLSGAIRSRRVTKDEMILRLGDGKAVAAEAVGSVELAISHHVEPDFVEYGPVHDEFYCPLSFWGYALETATKLLNMVPSKKISQMPYEISHGKPASYK